jgi:hypothetical protein
MERETIASARRSDRECDAARTPDAMRDAVHRRRLARAACEFEHALQQYERNNPLAAVFTDRFPVTLGR